MQIHQQQQQPINLYAQYFFLRRVETWQRNQFKRQHILRELLNLQQSYVNQLRFVCEDCKSILEACGIDESIYLTIYGNFQQLYLLHKTFLQQITARMQHKDEAGFTMSDVFLNIIPYFKTYNPYFASLNDSRNLILKLKDEGKLNKYTTVFKEREPELMAKYGDRLMRYLKSSDLIDLLRSRIIEPYLLILQRYSNSLPSSHPDKGPLQKCYADLTQLLHKVNESFQGNSGKKLMQLDQKYKSVLENNSSARRYINEYPVNIIEDSKLILVRLYVLSGLIIMVDNTQKQKEIARFLLNTRSWFATMEVGANLDNTFFIKGESTCCTILVPDLYCSEFAKVLTSMDERQSKKMHSRASLAKIHPDLIVKLMAVSQGPEDKQTYYFEIFFKFNGALRGTISTFTIQELQSVIEYLNTQKPKKPYPTLSQLTNINFGNYMNTEMTDYEIQYICYFLFKYFEPLLLDSSLVLEDPEVQFRLKIRDYVAYFKGTLETATSELLEYENYILQKEDILRLENIRYPQTTTIAIQMSLNDIRKVQIGKQEKVYSVLRKLFDDSTFHLDFSLEIESEPGKRRLLHDDEILYQCLQRENHVFEEETGFLWKQLSKIHNTFGKNCKVYLRKYLYLQQHYPVLIDRCTDQRIGILTDDILVKTYERSQKLKPKMATQILCLIIQLKGPGSRVGLAQQLVRQFWSKKVSSSYFVKQEYQKFRDEVFRAYLEYEQQKKIGYQNPRQLFRKLLALVQYWDDYAWSTEAEYEGRKTQLLINHLSVQLWEIDNKDWNVSQRIFNVSMERLKYKKEPRKIVFTDDKQEQHQVFLAKVAEVVHVLNRNRLALEYFRSELLKRLGQAISGSFF